MQKDLVSIITPCYNTGNVLHRLMDSILNQDYSYIEMFAVNDGSSDNTLEVLESYISKFDRKGYKLYVITQENAGQAAAVNSVLSKVSGEYLTWPDSDDFYICNDAISSMVKEFQYHDESYGLVRSIPIFLDEDDLTPQPSYTTLSHDENQFENCLYNRNFIWPPITYMARMRQFEITNPKLQIDAPYHAPQNWQMLLPLLFAYKCLTIDKQIAGVLVRKASYSRGTKKTYKQSIEYLTRFETIIANTIDSIGNMDNCEKNRHKKAIYDKYLVEKFNLALGYFQSDEVEAYMKEIKKNKLHLSLTEKIRYQLRNYPLLYKTLRNVL